MVSLPHELRLAMQKSAGEPLRISDPQTQSEYVLLPAATYDRLKDLVQDNRRLSATDQKWLLHQAGMRAGWDDPEMDIYNDLDPRQP